MTARLQVKKSIFASPLAAATAPAQEGQHHSSAHNSAHNSFYHSPVYANAAKFNKLKPKFKWL
jgi:hypothetical protein